MAKLSAAQKARIESLNALTANVALVETPVKGLNAATIRATFAGMSQNEIIEQGMTAAAAAQNVGNYASLHTMAQYLHFGHETLKNIIKELYPDSTNSTRQYMTRIVTACARAEKAGFANKIGTVSVRGLFELTAKTKETKDAERADKKDDKKAAEQKKESAPATGRSIAATLVNGFEALEALAERARIAAMSDNADANKALLAELAKLIPEHVTALKGGFSNPAQ